MAHTPARPPVASVRNPHLERLERLGYLLDNSIPVPGTSRRFGLDAVIGLIPGLGDGVGAAFSGYIIYQAARLGASKSTLLRMASNVVVETIVGLVPFLGDVFDAAWKANARNVALLHAHLEEPHATHKASRRFVAGLLVALLLLAAGAVATLYVLGKVLASHL